MLPDYPDLGRCPHCHILMRQSTSKKAKVKAQHDLPAGADWLCEPDEADWLESLQNRLWKSKDEKIYARIATWHRANDKVRQREAEPQFSALALQNLRELDALFRTGVEPFFVVLRAEIARETGDFEGALQLLESADSQFEPVTAQIAALARARDTSIKRRTA